MGYLAENVDLTGIYDKQIAEDNYTWTPRNIGLSRLGLCIRQTCLKMSQAPMRDIPMEEEEDTQRMFHIAKMIEASFTDSFMKDGILFGYQPRMSDALPEGLGGIADFLIFKKGHFGIVEMKTVQPQAMQYRKNYPKEHHKLQARGYCVACNNLGINVEEYCVYYVSRGGRLRPMTFWFDYNKAEEAAVVNVMNETLLAWRKCQDTGKYPEQHERDMEVKWNKEKKKYEIFLKPHWGCSYCDWAGVSCQPNMSRNKVGEYSKKKLTLRKDYEEYEKQARKLLISENIK